MDTEEGSLFIKNLAYYVRTHEKALANSLQSQKQVPKSSSTNINAGNGHASSLATTSSLSSAPTSAATFVSSLSLPYLGFGYQSLKPAKLYLTPNQLYYLLSRFEELGVASGPMNVRLENIHADHTPSNYVSFLAQAQRPTGRTSDQDSIHSVSSVRSVVSSMSSMWSSFSLSNTSAKIEKRKAAELEDLRYLYSAFTKIPCLKLGLNHRIPRITGYEEFPFDTAVPVYAFKNLSTLEIVDLDFRSIFGWDRLADQLRTLTLKRAGIEDLNDLLIHIVLDDADRRRRRSAKAGSSPVLANPNLNSFANKSELVRSYSTTNSPTGEESRCFGDRPVSADMSWVGYATRPTLGPRLYSISPPRPTSSRRGSAYIPGRPNGKPRNSSGSSNSSMPSNTPRSSSTNLSLLDRATSKWRSLRHLSLADNSIMNMTRQSLYPLSSTLHSLDLSANLFSEIPDSLASLVSLRSLNLSNCMIESLHSLSKYPLPAITILNLKGNRIGSLAGIEKLLSLERLDLRENQLRDPTELARLTGMPDFQGVFVARNPFVKTHSNYRIIMFNLFRRVPGYVNDITIDATGPGYGEKRYLNDRAQEVVSGPVIRTPVEEDVPPAPDEGYGSKVDDGDDASAETPMTPMDEGSQRAPRRRKGPKRRIVDIASNDKPQASVLERLGSDSLDPAFARVLQRPAIARNPTDAKSALPQTKLSPIPSSPDAQHKDVSATILSETERLDLSLSSEQYRKRIEALKREFGSSWLSALGDETRDVRTPDISSGYMEKGVSSDTPMSPNLTATNVAVLSTTRRLG